MVVYGFVGLACPKGRGERKEEGGREALVSGSRLASKVGVPQLVIRKKEEEEIKARLKEHPQKKKPVR